MEAWAGLWVCLTAESVMGGSQAWEGLVSGPCSASQGQPRGCRTSLPWGLSPSLWVPSPLCVRLRAQLRSKEQGGDVVLSPPEPRPPDLRLHTSSGLGGRCIT